MFAQIDADAFVEKLEREARGGILTRDQAVGMLADLIVVRAPAWLLDRERHWAAKLLGLVARGDAEKMDADDPGHAPGVNVLWEEDRRLLDLNGATEYDSPEALEATCRGIYERAFQEAVA